jgi:hypothetical protein
MGATVPYVYPCTSFPVCPFVVTVTSTVPAACAGTVAVIFVPFTTVTLVAAMPSKATVLPGANPAPVRVTGVFPVTVPEEGLTLARRGTLVRVKVAFTSLHVAVTV